MGTDASEVKCKCGGKRRRETTTGNTSTFRRLLFTEIEKIIVLVYTYEVISTKSERKPLKSTICLTDQITRKFKNRSLQNFQTLRKQQRIVLTIIEQIQVWPA